MTSGQTQQQSYQGREKEDGAHRGLRTARTGELFFSAGPEAALCPSLWELGGLGLTPELYIPQRAHPETAGRETLLSDLNQKNPVRGSLRFLPLLKTRNTFSFIKTIHQKHSITNQNLFELITQ